MKKWCILLLCLILCGCSKAPSASQKGTVATELLPQRAYSLTYKDLNAENFAHAPMIQRNDMLFFAKNSTIFSLSLQTGALAPLQSPALLTDDVATETVTILALAEGEYDTFWAVEQVTPILSEDGEPLEHPTPYLRLRCYSAQWRSLSAFPIPQVGDMVLFFAHKGDTLVFLTPQGLTYLRTDGELLAHREFSDPAYALVSYEDSFAILTEGERGRAALQPLDMRNFTDLERITLPFSLDAISYSGAKYRLPVFTRDNLLFFPCEGNLFSCEISTGKVQKLADWLDYDINPVYLTYQTLLSDGSVAGFQWENGALRYLRLTPTDAPLPTHALTLSMLSTDLPAYTLVMDYNRDHPDMRVRVVNYGEYLAFGLAPRSQFSHHLSAGTAGDMVFSSNRDLPVTELAAGNTSRNISVIIIITKNEVLIFIPVVIISI